MTKSEAINTLIDIAEKEIGYLEKKSGSSLGSKTANAGNANQTKYWSEVQPSFQGQPWCAAFVSWCFMKAFGLASARKLLKHWPYVYCPTLGSLFTRHTSPRAGDIAIFSRNGTYVHTGIVTQAEGNRFRTIEGNTSGASGIIDNGGGVCQKTYTVGGVPGTRFCRPDWSLAADISPADVSPKKTNSGKAVSSDTGSTDAALNRTPKWTGTVTASELNVRTWAGTEYPNLTSRPALVKGSTVDVCDTVSSAGGADWYYIRIDGQYYGFASAKYIRKI